MNRQINFEGWRGVQMVLQGGCKYEPTNKPGGRGYEQTKELGGGKKIQTNKLINKLTNKQSNFEGEGLKYEGTNLEKEGYTNRQEEGRKKETKKRTQRRTKSSFIYYRYLGKLFNFPY